MPNLVGIWNPDLPEDSIRNIHAKQLHRVRVPHCTYTEYVVAFPGFGMALQDHGLLENGLQPVFSDDNDAGLLLDGEINNARELQQQFVKELPQRVLSPPELCLKMILRR